MQATQTVNQTKPLLQLLSSINQLDISLSVNPDGQLKVSGDKSRLTPDLIAQIKIYKTEILDMLSQQHERQQENYPLQKLNLQKAPLSTYQRGIWFIMQVEPDSSAYNSHFEFDVEGKLDEQRLARAWRAVLNRHDVLRTSYGLENDVPYQQVNNRLWDAFEKIDFKGASERDINTFSHQFVKQSYDLNKGELCKLALLQLDNHKYILLMCLHHIVIDIWSVELLMMDLMQAYSSDLELPDLPLQYLDFASWQYKNFESGKTSRQRLFWESYLAEAPKTSLALKEAYYDESLLGQGGTLELNILGAKQAIEMADELNVTPFSLHLTIFQLVLSLYADEQDMTIGAPLVNRVDPRLESTIGYFTNVLPVRTQINGESSVSSIIKKSHRSLIVVMENQDITLDEIARYLNVERNLNHSPFYNIDFSYHKNTNGISYSDNNIVIKSRKEESAEALFELSFSLVTSDDEANLSVLYDKGLFNAEFIEQLLVAYQDVLHSVLEQGDVLWQDLKLPAAEHLCHGSNNGLQIDYNWTQRLSKIAQKYPQATACIDDTSEVDYAGFWRDSCKLAIYLSDLGVLKGEIVALYLDSSISFAIGMIAVLRLGAVVLPIDITLPLERRKEMLVQSDCQFVISSDIAEFENLNIINYQSDNWRNSNDIDLPVVTCDGGDAAFLFYTSGTSGSPKGIELPHAALNCMFLGMAERISLTSETRALQFASVGFSVLIEECIPAWSHGGSVVFSEKLKQVDPKLLCAFIKQKNINILELSAGMWKQMILFLEQHPNALPESLQTILLGCESISSSWLERWKSFDVDLLTVFGLSETSVTNATYQWTANDKLKWPVLPIGDVFAGSQLYVLDQAGRPVMEGACGELFIGGLAIQGRYRKEISDVQRYLPDPFSKSDSAIMFRTGDQVRRLGKSHILHLGRRDRQLKIQGHRVELAEIERHINNNSQVSNSLVRHYQQDGKSSLCCFVQRNRTISEQTIQKALRAKLPYYMVPSRIFFVDEIPLNINGKVDEKALLAMFNQSHKIETNHKRDLTENEQKVASTFKELLKLSHVNLDDNFFKLGGHSLMAMGLITRLKSSTGFALSIRTIFENPTVQDLAQALEQESAQELPELIPQTMRDTIPLSFSQRRIWFIDQLMQGSTQYNMPYAFKLQGVLDIAVFKQAINELVARHQTIRTIYFEKEGEPYGRISEAYDVIINEMDLRHLESVQQQQEAAQFATQDAAYQFDLSRDLMMRVTLLKLAKDSHGVLLNIHHIAADGLSINILIDELSSLYRTISAGQGAKLLALPVSYADYCIWQKQWMASEVLDNGVEYWMSRLKNLSEVHALPLDRPRPKSQSFAGAHVFSRIDEQTTEQVKVLCKQHNVTEFMFWQTAFALLIARFSQNSNVVMGTPVAGRVTQNIEPLVGCFINTLVLRNDFNLNQGFIDLLQQNKQDLLSAYAYQHVPFEYLVDRLNPSRSTSHSPLFQILFRLDNFNDAAIELGSDIRLEGMQQDNLTTQYELMLAANSISGTTEFCWSYASSIFDVNTIQSLANSFNVLVSALVAQPEKPVWKHPLWLNNKGSNSGNVIEEQPISPVATVLEGIHRGFDKYKNKTALIFGEARINYNALQEDINIVSGQLLQAGVSRDSLVGIMLPRGPETIISMLAVMQVGAAFVPLDLGYPENRLKYMIEDSGLHLLISHSSLNQTALFQTFDMIQRPKLFIDELSSPDNQQNYNSQYIIPLPAPTDRAYVIYTSGTTGQPKGIEIEHGALAHFVSGMLTHVPESEQNQAWLMLTSINFDISLFEWLGCLLRGDTCHIVSDEKSLDPQQLAKYINDIDWGFIQTTPSRWSQLFDSGLKLRQGTLVASGGETINSRLLEKFGDAKVNLLNCYGPTEATVWSMVKRVPLHNDASSLHLGGTLPGYQHFVLDDHLNVSPVAAIGELYIAGPALARGYLNRKALTEQRFINWKNVDGKFLRLYKTGDKVRANGDDSFVYCGRSDHQVKIRGYRIELEEIEQQLMSFDVIGEAVVQLKNDKLVAWLTSQEQVTEVSLLPMEKVELLQNKLAQTFPEYMLPHQFVVIPFFPITPNGKIDRKQLPELQLIEPQNASEPPQGEYEQFVAQCWSELLLVREQTIESKANFFALGGHSLLTLRFLALVKTKYQVELPVNTIFANPKLTDIAQHLENAVWLQKNFDNEIREDDMELLEL